MATPMPLQPAELERHVDATAALIGLPIGAAYRVGVLRYFGLAASLAELVLAHPLQAGDEPAPVFTPVSAPSAAP